MRDVRVATVQVQHAAGDKAYNLGRIRACTAEAAQRGAEIVAFPELCITGYWHVRRLSQGALDALAEPVPDGPSTAALLELARQHGMSIGAGLVERAPGGRFRNSYVVAMPDGRWACHRKLHAFESPWIDPGDAYTVFDTPHGCRVGVLICYDNNIVENVRATALLGAEVLLAPHQTGGCNSVSPRGMKRIDPALWERRREDPAALAAALRGPSGRGWLMRWLPARAHDNGLFLVFSNGIGPDDDEIRTGAAMVLDPYGEILAECTSAGDELVTADLVAAEQPLATGRRWLQARRPELYGILTERTGAELDTRQVRFGGQPPEPEDGRGA